MTESIPDAEYPSAPLVSVVIPTHNRLGLLREAVASVRRQTLTHWQLLVIDDGSDDGTRQWLSTLDGNRTRVVLLEGHVERARARNTGLWEARAPYVLFLDDDDELFPHALEYMHRHLSKRSRCTAFVAGAEVFSASGTYRGPRALWIPERRPWREALGGWCALTGQTLFRRNRLVDVGGFEPDTVPSEDLALWLRLGHDLVGFGRRRVLRVRVHAGQGSAASVHPAALQASMRQTFAAGLDDPERREAFRAITFGREWDAAQRAYVDAEGPKFRRHVFRAVRADPALAASPLMRAGLVRRFAKSFLPGASLPALRRARSSMGWGVVE